MVDTETKHLMRPQGSGVGKQVRAKDIFEKERIAHTQHLQLRNLPSLSGGGSGGKTFTSGDTAAAAVSSSSPPPPSFPSVSFVSPLRIGIVGATRFARKQVAAISNPASLCSVVAVASRDWEKEACFIGDWCEHHDVVGDIVIKGGKRGYDELITSKDLVDALYVPLPLQLRKELVIKALESGKHVLIELPVSMTVADYLEMIEAAKKANKFLMDGTMFMHQHRLEIFLDHVSSRKLFGKIMTVDVEFCVMHDDKSMDEHVWPSQHDDSYGVISSLGWYCVRFGLLIYTQVGLGTVKSVQVLEVGKNDAGHPMDAKCKVTFDKDHEMTFHCSFAHHTRQKAEVIGDEHTATIYDFAFPKHNFTSYQVRGKAVKDEEDHTVESFDTIDCGAGPPQEVILWRNFSRLSRGIDDAVAVERLRRQAGGKASASDIGWGASEASKEALELSSVSVQTQVIVDALMESIHEGGVEILLPYAEL